MCFSARPNFILLCINTHPAKRWYAIDVSGNDRHILLFYKKSHFCHLLPFAKVWQSFTWGYDDWGMRNSTVDPRNSKDLGPVSQARISGLVYGVFIDLDTKSRWPESPAAPNLWTVDKVMIVCSSQYSDLIIIPLYIFTVASIMRRSSSKNLCSRCFIGFVI